MIFFLPKKQMIRYTVALSLIDGTKILLVGLTVLTNLYTDGALSRTNDFFCGLG